MIDTKELRKKLFYLTNLTLEAWVIEELLDRLEVAEKERDNANQRYSSAVRLLTGIHALLYPPRFTDNDGRTRQFKSPLAEEQMQELSDRIRALPDEIARAALEKSK